MDMERPVLPGWVKGIIYSTVSVFLTLLITGIQENMEGALAIAIVGLATAALKWWEVQKDDFGVESTRDIDVYGGEIEEQKERPSKLHRFFWD